MLPGQGACQWRVPLLCTTALLSVQVGTREIGRHPQARQARLRRACCTLPRRHVLVASGPAHFLLSEGRQRCELMRSMQYLPTPGLQVS